MIPFMEKMNEGKVSGWFELPRISGDFYIDMKMEGRGIYGSMLEVELYSDGYCIYSNVIRLCEFMGLFITLPAESVRSQKINYVFSQEVTVKEIELRDVKTDVYNMQQYASEQTHASMQYTQNYAKESGLYITWFVTWLCNYKCPYCWERLDEDKYRKLVSNINKNRPEEWARAFNELKPDELYITGGEPTIYQKLPDVIRNLNDGIRVKMTTNFGETFELDKYSEFIREGRFSQLTASFHPTEIELELFLKKVDEALNMGYGEGCDFAIELVLYPTDIKYAKELIQYCKKNRIKLILDRYADPKSEYQPTDEEREIIEGLICESLNNNLSMRTSEKKQIEEVDRTDFASIKQVVLCGAGRNGIGLCNELLRNGYTGIRAFCDNKKGGKENKINGIEILSFEKAVADYIHDTLFVITVANKSIVNEMITDLQKLGVDRSDIRLLRPGQKKDAKIARKGKPIWCPAGVMSMHVDPEGDVYPCMIAINNMKLFGKDTMPIYKKMGNIIKDGHSVLREEPHICWESYRCSACDYILLANGMSDMALTREVFLPIPE